MIRFLANNIEQTDLALEHVSIGDANNARFGLMLIDNVVEITLHQIAKDKHNEACSWEHRENPYEHAKALAAALGQHFEAKVQFARKIGQIESDDSNSLLIFHSFRNEVYHVGAQHEAVLSAVAQFYLKVACRFLRSYSPQWISYGPGMRLPERAKKYFQDLKFVNAIDDYHAACATLGSAIPFDPIEFATKLADHFDDVIEQQDTAVDMIATGGPRRTSRDEAVAETMAWKIAFTEKGKRFARDWAWPGGSVFDFVKWIEKNYPIAVKRDPIASWKKRAQTVRSEKNRIHPATTALRC